jgi:predicted RNase H-like HicB family nuclease
MKCLIILEPPSTGFSAYSPDLDGCVAAGNDRDETVALMREAIAFHLEGLTLAGEPIPTPSCESAYVEVSQPV